MSELLIGSRVFAGSRGVNVSTFPIALPLIDQTVLIRSMKRGAYLHQVSTSPVVLKLSDCPGLFNRDSGFQSVPAADCNRKDSVPGRTVHSKEVLSSDCSITPSNNIHFPDD